MQVRYHLNAIKLNSAYSLKNKPFLWNSQGDVLSDLMNFGQFLTEVLSVEDFGLDSIWLGEFCGDLKQFISAITDKHNTL